MVCAGATLAAAGGLISRPEGEYASAGFHLSIHAGEDYSHPLSGLRHIDETVRFCEMRDGDRLGHALALGIEPQWWMARQGEMILPADEHLDNLVWLWHYAVTLSGRLPLAQQVQSLLARRIARFFPASGWHSVPDLTGGRHSARSSMKASIPKFFFAPGYCAETVIFDLRSCMAVLLSAHLNSAPTRLHNLEEFRSCGGAVC